MKKLYLISSLFFTIALSAQIGTMFPAVKGSNLEDKAINVPAKNGKYSVIAIAFHRDAEDQLKKWLNPLYDSFIKTEKKSSQEFDMAEMYDVNFVFIPMISGFRKVADEFKSKTDKHFWAYILDTEKTDVQAVRESLGISDKKEPYFFVLDKSGKVVQVQSGSFSPAKLEKLEDAVE
jgi:hypothetical protein